MSDRPAGLDGTQNIVTVLPQAGASRSLIASSTLTQDFNGNISTVRSVVHARNLTLHVKYTGGTGATDGYAHILVMCSNANDAPAIGDDSWDALPFWDVTATDADLTSTLPTGADFTAGPVWRVVEAGALILKTQPADAAEEVRQRFRLSVDDVRWVYVAAAEVGQTSNDGTIAIDYSLSV